MASRFLYLAFEGVIAVFLYLRLQRRGFASFGPVFLFLLFAPSEHTIRRIHQKSKGIGQHNHGYQNPAQQILGNGMFHLSRQNGQQHGQLCPIS